MSCWDALAAYNDLSKTTGGWSPYQRLLGRTPLTGGDVLGDPESLPLHKAELAADDDFGVNMELRHIARHAFIEAEASQPAAT